MPSPGFGGLWRTFKGTFYWLGSPGEQKSPSYSLIIFEDHLGENSDLGTLRRRSEDSVDDLQFSFSMFFGRMGFFRLPFRKKTGCLGKLLALKAILKQRVCY